MGCVGSAACEAEPERRPDPCGPVSRGAAERRAAGGPRAGARPRSSARSPRRRSRSRAYHRRIGDNAVALREAYRQLADDVHRGIAVPPSAEWLLDNFHLVEAEVAQLRRDLPPAYHSQLPLVAPPGARATARIHLLAVELLRHSDARLDVQRFERFLSAYQTVTPLSIGEIWAWPSALKAALIENMRRLTDEVLASREARRRANAFVAPLEAQGSDSDLRPLPRELSTAFVVELLTRMREFGPRARELRARLEERLRAEGRTVEDLILAEQQAEAAAQVSLANTVTSLRLCASHDWSRSVERVSLVEQILQRDPAGVYGRMDFASRDRYRQAIEELAEPSGEAQVEAALAAVEQARAAHERGADNASGHVGYHLIGARPARARAARGVPPAARASACGARSSATPRPATSEAVALVTAAVVAAAAWAAHELGASRQVQVVLALLALLPASDLATSVVQRLVAALAKPRRLPRLDLESGVPEQAETMVVIPTLLESVAGVHELVEHLEVQALGNLDPQIHFAILGDFEDAETAERRGDAEILEAAIAEIEALDKRHGERPLLPVPSRAPLQPERGLLHGLGAQARQARRVRAPAARRAGHELQRHARATSRCCPASAT